MQAQSHCDGLADADLTVIDVNDVFLSFIGRPLQEVVGRSMAELVPTMPEGSDYFPEYGPLLAAMMSGRREAAKLMRRDVEDPGHPGVFVARYWAAVAQPIRAIDGHVEVLEFSARDITPIVSEFQAMQAQVERSAG